ncbi:hypothetical protein PJF56_07115 [Roseofilum sp. BLCC_M91]|uniref:Uncharacterized protein n=1 Tax=Roseofilum halophilum BLCC-M91 TaxID=3022259 RepID=A0ABT7BIL6_9CYAN|nr:hypothetical protein [Roseofilum halophilum]MDJ1178627.1 hypothetical protein [Roseofilum halophilum BLCC-M91]
MSAIAETMNMAWVVKCRGQRPLTPTVFGDRKPFQHFFSFSRVKPSASGSQAMTGL